MVVTPKIIHLVWLGKPPMETYFKNILSFYLLNPDYRVYLWTDNVCRLQKGFFCSQSESLYPDVNFSRLSILPISDLMLIANRKVKKCIIEEMNGHYKNFAAASDFLRLLALKKHGGIYVDTDISCKKPLGNLYLDSGIGFSTLFIDNFVYNASMAATPSAPILDLLLDNMVKKYQDVFNQDMTYFYQPGSDYTLFQWGLSTLKRKDYEAHTREQQTINMSGPGIIRKTLEQVSQSRAPLKQIFGMPEDKYRISSDKTWLKRPKKPTRALDW